MSAGFGRTNGTLRMTRVMARATWSSTCEIILQRLESFRTPLSARPWSVPTDPGLAPSKVGALEREIRGGPS
jgi:hypothetical protein